MIYYSTMKYTYARIDVIGAGTVCTVLNTTALSVGPFPLQFGPIIVLQLHGLCKRQLHRSILIAHLLSNNISD